MTRLRSFAHFACALALAVALAGCGDVADQGDAGGGDDTGESGDSGDADDAGNESDDAGDDGGGSDGDAGSEAAAPGVYQDYSAEAVADTSYETTILFFHASWCPECRAFDEAIQDQGVPDGVQILKTDYDTEQDLKEKYGITIQSSFVKVDPDGNELSKWVGYGEDRSVDTILEQLE